MHHTDARYDDTSTTDRHPTDGASARCAFWIVAALIVGCGSSDDVVAEVEPTVTPSPSANVVGGSGTVAPVSGGSGTAAIVGGIAADPNGAAPSAGSSRAPVPLRILPAEAPAVAGTLFVSGIPNTERDGSPPLWPFPDHPLRQVFGDAPGSTIRVTDPFSIERLRELVGDDGISPIVAPALVTVMDAVDDRYDLAIWDNE
jgi:hypothetical protein